jgi:protein-S-isoprenylcysteine O-methyltransferase Ste14
MVPLAYTDVVAKTLFYVLLGVFGASEWSIRIRGGLNRGGTRIDRGSFFVVIVTSVLGGAAFSFASAFQGAGIASARWPIFIVGLIIMVRGIALRQWAVLVLGQFFAVQVRLRDGQTVVDTGPYRFVRHPSYKEIVRTFQAWHWRIGGLWRRSLSCPRLDSWCVFASKSAPSPTRSASRTDSSRPVGRD